MTRLQFYFAINAIYVTDKGYYYRINDEFIGLIGEEERINAYLDALITPNKAPVQYELHF